MKKRFEHDELLADVLADTAPEQFRIATLDRGLAAMRRTRTRRRALRLAMCVVAIALMATWVVHNHRTTTTPVAHQSPAQTEAGKTIEGTTIRVLSDEELLAYFKDRPV